MDAIENENFFESIFSDMDKRFWYKRESWRSTKKIFGYRFDAWHVAKSMMIILMVLAAVLYEPVLGQLYDFLLCGVIWNFTFWLFYHKIFGVK
jgi:hypothetical protein